MKKILVTGSYGFVGSNIAKHFSEYENINTTALDVIEGGKNLYHSYVSWENLDQINWNSLDTIIHLAGKAHDTNNSSDPQSYFEINYGLTKIVFDKYLQSDAKKFIYFSSVKAVADTVDEEYLIEDIIPNPKTPYGQSKLKAEQYILNQVTPSDKLVYILRPSMIHGPGNKGNLNLLFSVIQKGIPYPLGTFDNKRSFTSIENVLFIIQELIEKTIDPGVYNVCDDEPVSTNELIRLIAKSCGKKPKILYIPKVIMIAIAAIGDVLHIPLNSERLKKLTESYVASNKKLTSALGIKRLPVSSKEGLIRTFQSFNNQ